MQKLIRNYWINDSGKPYARAKILHYKNHPEGLDLDRLSFHQNGSYLLNPRVGHIVSIYQGSALLRREGAPDSYHLGAGVHVYLPPGRGSELVAESGAEILHLFSPSAAQARGDRMLLVDEEFLAACATTRKTLRWSFTPHFLSRLIFLHHDQTLLSKTGNPISWFRTTMFDADGLPENEEGDPVFRISYNFRTELNVCCEVQGRARVRMAKHPYRESLQPWGPWLQLDGDSSYHLNEATGSREEEYRIDEVTESLLFFRNKHEICVEEGHVTFFCLFDPAPTGLYSHRGGTYREEEPLPHILGTSIYDAHLRALSTFDTMVQQLSVAKAKGSLELLQGTPAWEIYQEGKKAQVELEREVVKPLVSKGNRPRMLAQWMQRPEEVETLYGAPQHVLTCDPAPQPPELPTND